MLLHVLLKLLFIYLYYVKQNYCLINPDVVGSIEYLYFPCIVGSRLGPKNSHKNGAGDLSRNRTVGLRIGRGESLGDIMGGMTAVAEGVLTSKSAHALASKLGVEVGFFVCFFLP